MAYRQLALLVVVLLWSLLVTAQVPAPSPLESSSNPSASGYRIGTGDLLEIRVFGVEQLNREVRVDNRGFISLPRIDEPINAQCMTELELAQLLESKYSKYIRSPHVDVSVKDYQGQPVAVIGAVKQAGRFQLRRRVRLLELLAYAGGPTDAAGMTINILHDDEIFPCHSDSTSRSAFETVPLKDLFEGRPEANFYVQPGDIVTIPNANVVFVAGNVAKPGPQPINGHMTVSKAIAMAGGIQPNTAKDKIRVIRQNPGATDTEITVNLTAVEKRKAEDIELHTNDIVMVPDSNSPARTIFRTMFTTLGVGLGNTPFTIIR